MNLHDLVLVDKGLVVVCSGRVLGINYFFQIHTLNMLEKMINYSVSGFADMAQHFA